MATLSHPRNATTPLIAILVEALHYLSNELENTLFAGSQLLVNNFCQRLRDRIPVWVTGIDNNPISGVIGLLFLTILLFWNLRDYFITNLWE